MMARYILLSLFCFSAVISVVGQSIKKQRADSVAHILKENKLYIPDSLRYYTLLVVEDSRTEKIEKIRKAHYLSYHLNGIDTTTNPEAWDSLLLKSFEKRWIKDSVRHLKWTIKRFGKHYPFDFKPISLSFIKDYDKGKFRFLLFEHSISSRKTPEEAWVIYGYYFFYDRVLGRKYKPISIGYFNQVMQR